MLRTHCGGGRKSEDDASMWSRLKLEELHTRLMTVTSGNLKFNLTFIHSSSSVFFFQHPRHSSFFLLDFLYFRLVVIIRMKTPSCIVSGNPDITGIGVRLALYIQSFSIGRLLVETLCSYSRTNSPPGSLINILFIFYLCKAQECSTFPLRRRLACTVLLHHCDHPRRYRAKISRTDQSLSRICRL